jgi:hypothetical protein
MSRRSDPLLILLAAITLFGGWTALAPRPAVAAGTADLVVTMVGEKKNLKFGDTMTFTITVTNLGPDHATGVVLSIGVSDSYGALGAACPDGSTSTICDVGSLEAGASVTVPFRAMACCSCCPERLGVAVATVSHDSDTIDPDANNNSVRIETKLVGKSP